jgi:hypothetical protein
MARRKNNATLAPTVTSPAKMGEEMAHPVTGTPQSPNLKSVAKGGAKGGSIPREKGAPGRTNVLTDDNVVPKSPERLGAQWAPQMLMSSPQAPEAAQNTRNTRLLRPAAGSRDFWYKRQYGQTGNFG